MRQIFTI